MANATAVPATPLTPPYLLEGQKLDKGWVVGKRMEKQPGQTGGHFSVGYDCTSANGTPAFLKAIDLYRPLQNRGGDVLKALQPFIQAVQGERELLGECRHMDRVVTAIDHGDLHELDGASLLIPVPYIIFERADHTARAVVFSQKKPTHGWCLRTLHHVAVGVWQLHGSMIAHQDIKLSNVLMFPKQQGAKISDLGRSVQQGRTLPHDNLDWPGDRGYAPPEYAYGYTPSEFNVRRLAADLFLLGSCACNVFTGVSINGLLYSELPKDFHPRWQNGPYTGTFTEALPYLIDAFERVLARIRAAIHVDAPYRDQIVTMIREWCEPDPQRRGHPTTRMIVGNKGNVYSLERYLAQIDNLARRAEAFDYMSKR